MEDTFVIPNAEGSIGDVAWNPVDKHRFALITTTGSVYMFTVNPQQKSHINSLGHLPASVQARCRKRFGHFHMAFYASLNWFFLK